MKFGIRECANITFRAKQETTIGTATFHAGQPVLYIDTATTSTEEQATTAVYAQGGRGNSRLISWEGDKTLTFTVTDALLSPISLAMLTGAGLVKENNKQVHVHATTAATLTVTTTSGTTEGVINLTEALADFGDVVGIDIGEDAPIFIMGIDEDGSLTGDLVTGTITNVTETVSGTETTVKGKLKIASPKLNNDEAITTSMNVLVDYYVIKNSQGVSEIQITPYDFAGYYYVEADTLFRRQNDGVDMPANLTLPNVKLQSNFSIALSGSGDPSTFDFTMDAFPGYTYFNKNKKVLCVIQVVEDTSSGTAVRESVMLKDTNTGYDSDDAGNPFTHDSFYSASELGG